MARATAFFICACALLSFGRHASAGLTFNLVNDTELQALQSSNPSLYANVRGGFDSAAAKWAGLFSDNITVNITINYKALGSGILGQAGSNGFVTSYSDFKTALAADITSATDSQAVSGLQSGSSFNMLTIDRSTGTTVIDNNGSTNNTMMEITSANAKALGLVSAVDPGTDAAITFSSNFSFDFDPTNGITGGQYDFVGVAAHEIGHALGFVSGVDAIDFYAGSGLGKNNDLNGADPGLGTFDEFPIFSSLDMFRYSTNSKNQGLLDLAYGTTSYFSLDGGTTSIGLFSTGAYNGDGRQASHWKDSLALGIMDPTLAPGELAVIRTNDLLALDAIGFNLSAVPEPSSMAAVSLVGVAWLVCRARRRSKISPESDAGLEA